jgi:CBS domain containing-hemolysin-like protein
MDEGSWLSLIAILFLLFGAAYFALIESAFSSVGKIRLKARMDRGDRRASRALYVLDHFERAITTILIGANLVQIITAALATVLVVRHWGVGAVTVSTVIVTIAVFFLGEMLPKSIGKKYSERFALGCASSLCFFMRIFAPISAVLTALGSAVTARAGDGSEPTFTEDEFYDIIENMKDEGELGAEQGELVHSALLFGDVTVESVLTSRVDIAAIDIADSPEEVLATIKESRHSRLPVYEDSIDNIIGVLQIRKYIKAYLKQGSALNIRELLDEAYYVHQSANIDELLPVLSRKKLNLAVVTDSYGGTLGIVTVEDILEELVGEIWDEEDEVEVYFKDLGGGVCELDAELEVEVAFSLLHFEDPDDLDFEHKLLGEWAYEQLDHFPNEGDTFRYNGLELTVSLMRQRRIVKLTARLLPEAEGGARA